MLLLQRTVALSLPWCLLLALPRRATSDEEAAWGTAAPEKKSWWSLPSFPKIPSLPDVSFLNPFGGSSTDPAATTRRPPASTPASPGPEGPPASTQRRNDSDRVVPASDASGGGSAESTTAPDPPRRKDPPATTEPAGTPGGHPDTAGVPTAPSAVAAETAPSAVAAETDPSAGASPDTPDTGPDGAPPGGRPRGPGTPPGPAPGTTPGPAPGTTPGPAPGTTPGPAPGTTPLTTSQTPSGGSVGAGGGGGGGGASPPGAERGGGGPSAATEERSTAGFSPSSGARGGASSVPGETTGSEDTNDEDDDEESVVAANRTKSTSPAAEVSTAAFKPPTTPGRLTTAGAEHNPPTAEAWTPAPADPTATLLPDCNAAEDSSGVCNFSYTWESRALADAPQPAPAPTPTPASASSNQSHEPFVPLNPAMLVPLYADWNSAMATWGPAWHAHVYSAGLFFAAVALASALNLLCLPLRCPSGCGYFALVSVFLLAAGATRSFSLLYDAYGHRGGLPSAEAGALLQEAPFPCLTAAFGLVFLLLSMRSRMQLSYSAFQRPFFLACLVALHFVAAFGPVALLHLYRGSPSARLFLCLLSRGAFVALAAFLSAAYFVFYVYVRADSKHIYHLNNTSPTPAERYNRCPFAESRDWDRAAVTVCVSALFCLGCAGLQLYAMLSAMGVAGGEELFRAWPWWTFQFSCRVCELGVCVTLALVVAQPVHCSAGLPGAGSCWTELLAAKSPLLPGTYHWTLSQQEKLAMAETGLGLGETESLPLYTLVDERLGSLNGLDLLYHSNRALAYRDLDLTGSEKPDGLAGGAASGRSSVTSDSTADLRPPSPIDLRRSIDEALFGESLFPMSLFSPNTPLCCSDLSLAILGPLPNGGHSLFGRDPLSADAGLYRTSSCAEVPAEPTSRSRGVTATTAPAAPPSPSPSTSTTCSSPERWRGSSSSCASYRPSFGGSSLVLCPGPDGRATAQDEGAAGRRAQRSAGHQSSGDPQRRYQTLGSASQESLAMEPSSEADRSLQEEFISVCRQMDASSVCSETIDL